MKILLMEDDPILSDILYDHLINQNFDVKLSYNGEEALDHIENEKFDLMLLDINVPLINGLEVLQTVREYQNNTPVIMLTAYQDIQHLKQGFNIGCDDYIKKPFDLEELDERINNIKRHFHIENQNSFMIGTNIAFNPTKKQIIIDDKTIQLSQKESEILNYFNNNRARVISNDELIQNIWTFEDMPSDATLRVYIKNIRNIIGKDKIQTIRGSGYCFE